MVLLVVQKRNFLKFVALPGKFLGDAHARLLLAIIPWANVDLLLTDSLLVLLDCTVCSLQFYHELCLLKSSNYCWKITNVLYLALRWCTLIHHTHTLHTYTDNFCSRVRGRG